MRVESVRGHHFLGDRLAPDAVVVDLGAHRGEFSSTMVARWGCRCIAVEPSPALFAHLPIDPKIKALRCAVGGVDGPVRFHFNENPEMGSVVPGRPGANVAGETVEGKTWRSFAAGEGISRVSLLKVDIEGAEIGLLDGMSASDLGAIEQISIEFHDFIDPGMKPDVLRVLARLAGDGFFMVRFSRGYGDVLLVNERLIALSFGQKFWLRHVVRNWLGLCRLLPRLLPSPRA